jgi:Myb-like DNA-binding domain
MNNQYTEKCCRHAWQQLCLPVISYNQNWSSEEDQLLINLVLIHGAYADQWELIALNFVCQISLSRFLYIIYFSLNVLHICVQIVICF